MIWRTDLTYRYAGQHINELQCDARHALSDITHPGCGVGNAQPVRLDDGKEYYVSFGYYLPAPPQATGEGLFAARDVIISELGTRLDSCAYVDRARHYSYEELCDLRQKYDMAHVESHKRQSYGAKLVLGAVDLIERIDRALIDQRETFQWTGIHLIPSTAQLGKLTEGYEEKGAVEQRQIRDQLTKQRSQLYKWLLDSELVGHLRRQAPIRHRNEALKMFAGTLYNNAPTKQAFSDYFDTSGVMSDMIRELGKAAAFHSEGGADAEKEQHAIGHSSVVLEQAKFIKIGHALQCMDAIKARIDMVCMQHPIFDRIPTSYLMGQLTDTARALVCTNDTNDILELEAQMFSIERELKQHHRTIKQTIAGGNKHELIDLNMGKHGLDDARKAINVIEFGYDLIADMVRTQLSCGEVFWPKGSEPPGVARMDDVAEGFRSKTPRDKTYASDVKRIDPRSNMMLFELYSDKIIKELAKGDRTDWAAALAATRGGSAQGRG